MLSNATVEQLTIELNLVIVVGHSGSGKSAIIQHIALRYRSQGWVVKLVNDVKEVKEIYNSNPNSQNEILFILNDPFGKRFFDEIAYNSWEAHEETLKVCLNKCKLLLSCRKYILSKDRVKGVLIEESNIVDIDEDELKLNNDEKQRIWNIYAHGRTLSNAEFAEILKTNEYFPLLCKLYFTYERMQNNSVLKYFKEPIKVIEEEIRNFRQSCKEKYCALVLLTLLNNALNLNEILENKNAKTIYKRALELCGMQKHTALYSIGDALKTLDGYFVKKIGDSYQFHHDFLMEVTTFVFGTDYPKDAIKFADISFFRKRVKIKSCNAKIDPFTIYVNDNDIVDLGKRFFVELLGERFLHVVLNPCMKDENMTKVLIKEFEDRPENLTFLLKKKKLPVEKQVFDQARELRISKLSFLTCKKQISPLCALIVYCHTDLSLHCLNTLKQKPIVRLLNFLIITVLNLR